MYCERYHPGAAYHAPELQITKLSTIIDSERRERISYPIDHGHDRIQHTNIEGHFFRFFIPPSAARTAAGTNSTKRTTAHLKEIYSYRTLIMLSHHAANVSA